MGWVSFCEDNTERFDETGRMSDIWGWCNYVGPTRLQRDVEEANAVLGDPLARPRRMIDDLWKYYRQQEPLTRPLLGKWEGHHKNTADLHKILGEVSGLDVDTVGVREVVGRVSDQLRAFFRQRQVYGALSVKVIDQGAPKFSGSGLSRVNS